MGILRALKHTVKPPAVPAAPSPAVSEKVYPIEELAFVDELPLAQSDHDYLRAAEFAEGLKLNPGKWARVDQVRNAPSLTNLRLLGCETKMIDAKRYARWPEGH